MNTDPLAQALGRAAGASCSASLRSMGTELLCTVDSGSLLDVVKALVDLPQYHHLSTITGVLGEGGVRVLYHFWLGAGLTLEVLCPAPSAALPSLVPLLPAADWYEREVHEMFGVQFVGHPHLVSLFLPDDWTEGPPMLAREEP